MEDAGAGAAYPVERFAPTALIEGAGPRSADRAGRRLRPGICHRFDIY